jgi:hypothetical protein
VAPGDVADGESHGEHGETEGKRNPDKADAESWISGCEYSGTATSKDQPEGAEHLSDGTFE